MQVSRPHTYGYLHTSKAMCSAVQSSGCILEQETSIFTLESLSALLRRTHLFCPKKHFDKHFVKWLKKNNFNESLFVHLHQRGAKNTQTSPNIFSWGHSYCCVLRRRASEAAILTCSRSSQGIGRGIWLEVLMAREWFTTHDAALEERVRTSILPSIHQYIHPSSGKGHKNPVCILSFISLHRGLKGSRAIRLTFDTALWPQRMWTILQC